MKEEEADEEEANEEREVVPISSLGCRGGVEKGGRLIECTKRVVRFVCRSRSQRGVSLFIFLRADMLVT